MASTTTAAPTAPGSGRLRQISLTQRVLARPAAGALIIVIFVWVVFLVLSLARGNTAFVTSIDRDATDFWSGFDEALISM